MPDISILILSDIHTTDKDPSGHASPSYVSTQATGTQGGIDPISAMVDVVKQDIGTVDFVVCPGDMTDQALPAGLTYIANRLAEVASETGAKELIVVAGNHDVDSRYGHNQYDPRGYLMSTFPEMPFKNGSHHLEFFAHHLTAKVIDDVRFLALDSAAFHGGGRLKKPDGSPEVPEFEHGRISPLMLQRIKKVLDEDTGVYTVNILICHHHPQNNNSPYEIDFSQMDGGPALIDLLDSGNYGRWLIVHGHKHRPRISYAAGGATSPVIFGAASFSAQIRRDALNHCPNQFHILTVKPELANDLHCGLAGSIQSWNWTTGLGWRPATTGGEGLPAYAGFGYRGDPAALAGQVSAALTSTESHSWSAAVAKTPALSALLPRNFDELKRELEKLGVNIVFNDRGIPMQVGRSTT